MREGGWTGRDGTLEVWRLRRCYTDAGRAYRCVRGGDGRNSYALTLHLDGGDIYVANGYDSGSFADMVGVRPSATRWARKSPGSHAHIYPG